MTDEPRAKCTVGRDGRVTRINIFGGTKPMDEWRPDERTVRACIDALPKAATDNSNGWSYACSRARERLEDLLPKPDPAKALVEEWGGEPFNDRISGHVMLLAYTRWLIVNDRIKA